MPSKRSERARAEKVVRFFIQPSERAGERASAGERAEKLTLLPPPSSERTSASEASEQAEKSLLWSSFLSSSSRRSLSPHLHQHENVQRVVVLAERLGDEAWRC